MGEMGKLHESQKEKKIFFFLEKHNFLTTSHVVVLVSIQMCGCKELQNFWLICELPPQGEIPR